ncbi:unnamed protein product [marine sediment metagenome]|uniref:HNH domain-containing protein n=1 Tax=marine sediment metagenome TaxID=412755 RepID=X1LUE0_9ZZZZ
MGFADDVIESAWLRAGGQCKCTRIGHRHKGQCNQQLFKAARGKDTPLGWEAHHVTAGGPDTLSNCEILCQSCHKQTGSYGG